MPVEGWREGGVFERSTWFSKELRGKARATISARSFATLPRPDLTWTSASQPVLPFLWSQVGPLRRPLVLDLDWTFEQQEQMAPIYFNRAARTGAALRFGLARERMLWRAVSLFTPWSTWAADSLRRQGIASERIRVLPPGIDLCEWTLASARWNDPEAIPHVLFVGADFQRKGGDMVLLAAKSMPGVHFDLVTPAPIAGGGNVTVHRATANSPALKALFANAHLLVLPSRADCFGLATVEAMAAGLPVIVTNVGGARDIVAENETGWLIPPDPGELIAAVQGALADRERLRQMGDAGRVRAERLFDGERNDRAIVDLMLELADERRRTHPAMGKTEAPR